jgi:hypothetical protein
MWSVLSDQNASAVMVWGAISRKGRLTLVFIDRGVKINAKYYKTKVLERILLPGAQKIYGDEYYCFQQDGAPSPTANIVQRWCEDYLTDFIPKDEWPPGSTDLNPLNISFWDYMLGQQENYKYATLPEFKKVIQRIWANILEHAVRAACDTFDKRLHSWSKPKGNRLNKMIFFSDMYFKYKIKKQPLFPFLEKKLWSFYFTSIFACHPVYI